VVIPHPAQSRSAWLVWLAAGLGILAIGLVDYLSGVELRVLPLYYVPISLVAWHVGRGSALTAAVLCAVSWLASNFLAGLHYSHAWLWTVNTLVQALSFATVGLLIATLRDALVRERGLSRSDPLTALPNTRAFYEDAERILALCRRQGRPVTLAYVDLDDFKAVNDRAGHQGGDELLRRFAGFLRAATRPSDICARLGGDEFAVLLADADSRDAATVLERLRAVLSEGGTTTGTIGAVTFVTPPESLQEMVSAADAQMYAAKAEGKNRLRLDVAPSR
jgi:diguanylate cyclase (GGDEF)-like protein